MSEAPLLDTHAWVWWVQGDARLGRHIVRRLDELPADDRPAISDISLWEVATLASLGRIEFPGTLEAWLAIAANPRTVRVLPVTPRIAAEVARLPDSFHRDPADRLIVATSRVHGLRVLTKDVAIAKSGLVKLWSPGAAATTSSIRERLPRVFELKDLLQDPDNEHAYFQDFESSIASNPLKQDAFIRLESQLELLDEASWRDLAARAARHLVSTTRDRGRGWQQLFDQLNEARAFGYLLRLGSTDIRFVAPGDTKKPDLAAHLDGRDVLCEVKTLNISDAQADLNQRVEPVGPAREVVTSLPDEFLTKKLAPTLQRALQQLSDHDATRKARWIIYVVVHFDEQPGEYHTEYFRQIDEYLLAQPVEGAELVLVPASNNFQRTFTMRSATVDLE